MSNKQIFQLPEKVTLNANDYIAISDSEDSNKTKHVKGVAFGNIYNTDGTLTGNRTVSYNGFDLTFGVANFGGTFKTISPSALASDTAFAVRNYLDTIETFYIAGNGNLYSFGSLADLSHSNGVKLSYLRTNVWNNASDTVNLMRYDVGADGFVRSDKPFKTISPSALASDTAFAVRNDVDNANHFIIKGNGFINSLATPNYADDTSADADVNLVAGDFYTTTAGGRTIFKKP